LSVQAFYCFHILITADYKNEHGLFQTLNTITYFNLYTQNIPTIHPSTSIHQRMVRLTAYQLLLLKASLPSPYLQPANRNSLTLLKYVTIMKTGIADVTA
jgi:hypothetical protein